MCVGERVHVTFGNQFCANMHAHAAHRKNANNMLCIMYSIANKRLSLFEIARISFSFAFDRCLRALSCQRALHSRPSTHFRLLRSPAPAAAAAAAATAAHRRQFMFEIVKHFSPALRFFFCCAETQRVFGRAENVLNVRAWPMEPQSLPVAACTRVLPGRIMSSAPGLQVAVARRHAKRSVAARWHSHNGSASDCGALHATPRNPDRLTPKCRTRNALDIMFTAAWSATHRRHWGTI